MLPFVISVKASWSGTWSLINVISYHHCQRSSKNLSIPSWGDWWSLWWVCPSFRLLRSLFIEHHSISFYPMNWCALVQLLFLKFWISFQNTILIGNIRKYIEGKLCTRKYKEAKRYSRWQPVREQCNSTPQPYCLCTANTKYPLWSILILEHWTLKFN